MKTNDRIRKEERQESYSSLEIIGENMCRIVSCIIVEQDCLQISLPFSFQLCCTGCDIPFVIILSRKARLSLLISVSRAKTPSSWSSFEDPIYCVPTTKSWTPHREA